MNILVTGGKGQLAQCIKIRTLSNKASNYIFKDVDELDITDMSNLHSFIKDNNIKCVINCAAYTNVERAQDDFEDALKVNVTGVRNIAECMKEVDGVLIHISTDYVFGSKYNVPIKEDFKKYGMSVYGITKFLGEQCVIESKCKHIIIRTSWLYSEYGHNFLKTIVDQLKKKSEINVVFDQVGSPTYAGDLANAIIDIIENGISDADYGVYHYSNEGVCSWYDFATMISKHTRTTCKILPCHSSEFPSNVERPSYSVLDKTKIKETFNIKIPYWYDSLKVCMKNIDIYV